MRIILAESNWITVRRCAENDGVAVLPLGSLEQHGPHLPLATDSFQITEIMHRALALVPESAHVCLLPVLGYTVVQWASPLASVGIHPETHTRVLVEITESLHEIGFRKMVLVHGHGGLSTGRSALWQAMQEKRPAVYVDLDPFEAAYEQLTATARESIGGLDGHAGAAETAMMRAVRPDLVKLKGVKAGAKSLYGDKFPFQRLQGRGLYTIPVIASVPDGYDGDPRKATTELGHKLLDILATVSARVIADLAAHPTPAEFKRVWRRKLT
jgi:creatinine amidohydrolase